MDQEKRQPYRNAPEDFLETPFSLGDSGSSGSLNLDLDTSPRGPVVEGGEVLVGGVWGRFEIRGFLGRGVMGQVFEALDRKSTRLNSSH